MLTSIDSLSLNPSGQKLRYNCKELQDQNLGGRQLDWYDYGARFYDPTLGRFHSIDPLAGKFAFQSGYAYAGNNPIRNIDYMGMDMRNFDDVPEDPVEYPEEETWAMSGYGVDLPEVTCYAYRNPSMSDEEQRQWDELIANCEGQTNWGVYITGAVLTVEDVYNNFIRNHKMYTTKTGAVKNIYKSNGAVRSARAAEFARTSTTVKALGTAGTALMTGVAMYNIVDAVSNNQSVSGLDIADGSVGAIGLTGGGLASVGIISNPVGWGIGAGVATYSWCRLWFDLGANYSPSNWFK